MRLPGLQRWMQGVVVHPGPVKKGSRPGKLESILLPSPALTAAQRIEIYREMYPIRMREALAADYPGIEHFLGDRFTDFVAAYTRVHPSRAYTLNRLGDAVPRFLARQTAFRPAGFLHDLARLELAITGSFDSPEEPALKARDIETIDPDALGRSVLVTRSSLRLVDLAWNAADYLDTLHEEDHDHPAPRRAKSWVAVVRRDYSVYRFPVSLPAFLVLADLQAGRTVASVVGRALSRRGGRRAALEDFMPWFRRWTSEGVFSGIDKPRTRVRKKKPKGP